MNDELLARIEALRREIDSLIDARAQEEAARSPGVPFEAVRRTITFHSNCQCAVANHLLQNEMENQDA